MSESRNLLHTLIYLILIKGINTLGATAGVVVNRSPRNQQIACSSVGCALHLSLSPSAARLDNKGAVV